jgi:phenylacetate-CoA ligase
MTSRGFSAVRATGAHRQLQSLNALLVEAWRRNAFYRETWRRHGLGPQPLGSLDGLGEYPLVSRDDLAADQRDHPPLGRNVMHPLEMYRHVHRSSGTSGVPLYWPDTPWSWEWLAERSEALHRLSGLGEEDRVVFLGQPGVAMGPSVIHEGLLRLGCTTDALERLPDDREATWLAARRPTVIVGKPSKLSSLARHLEQWGLEARRLYVRVLLAVGEPGGSDPGLRRELFEIWGAEIHDRYGLTEAGPVAAECPAHPGGMHLPEEGFIAECVDPRTGETVPDGDEGELVLTTLGRIASPIVRYRTGDLVRLFRSFRCGCGRPGPLLAGGVRRAPQQQVPLSRNARWPA